MPPLANELLAELRQRNIEAIEGISGEMAELRESLTKLRIDFAFFKGKQAAWASMFGVFGASIVEGIIFLIQHH